jgi:hypothetical protein
MNRKQLENAYENMMYKYGEFDVFDDDIKPKFKTWSLLELKKNYMSDKKYYELRKKNGGFFG